MENITIRELQDLINNRLERLSGRKYDGRKAARAEYHEWYMQEVAEELALHGIDFFLPAVWKIVAEIDGPGGVRVSFEAVAEVEVNLKADRRYKFGGPGVVRSIRVKFYERLQDLTVEDARVFLLKEQLSATLAYYRKERERIMAELADIEKEISKLAAITIEEGNEK